MLKQSEIASQREKKRDRCPIQQETAAAKQVARSDRRRSANRHVANSIVVNVSQNCQR
jgi:hypothetical protein